uniref:Zinc metalloprotease n=1 Tax=candidate division WOR-3 bacterium TaxID=2052148 RepID=A0A7C4CE61_UNCW3
MLLSVLLAAFFISILITVHEFGHLAVAKLTRIPVEAFSIGFGPVILKFKLAETEYRLSLVPLGGYIKMVGEEETAAAPAPSTPEVNIDGFSTKPLWVKVAVIGAGPLSNLILGFILLLTMYTAFGLKFLSPQIAIQDGTGAAAAGLKTGDLVVQAAGETIPSYERLEAILGQKSGQQIAMTVLRNGQLLTLDYPVPHDEPDIEPLQTAIIDRVRKGSPAARIGLRPGDRILSIANKKVESWQDFVATIGENGGVTLPISWEREGRLFTDSITPSLERDQMSEEKFGQVGVWVRLPKQSLALPRAVWEAARRTGYVVAQTYVILYKVVTRQISTRAIGGPIMVAKVAYEGANWGAEYFLALWALLSINLFVVNLLPVPVLDGGRILLDVIAGVRRRSLTRRELNLAAGIGWAMIGLLVAFTFFNDIIRLVRR